MSENEMYARWMNDTTERLNSLQKTVNDMALGNSEILRLCASTKDHNELSGRVAVLERDRSKLVGIFLAANACVAFMMWFVSTKPWK